MVEKTGRNDPCPCGSGKKYKNCCQGKEIKKTYTPEGKRKFTAKLLSGSDQSQSVFHLMGTPPMPKASDPSETLRFKKTKENYNTTEAQEPVFETTEFADPTPAEDSAAQPPEVFEPTKENYEKKD